MPIPGLHLSRRGRNGYYSPFAVEETGFRGSGNLCWLWPPLSLREPPAFRGLASPERGFWREGTHVRFLMLWRARPHGLTGSQQLEDGRHSQMKKGRPREVQSVAQSHRAPKIWSLDFSKQPFLTLNWPSCHTNYPHPLECPGLRWWEGGLVPGIE